MKQSEAVPAADMDALKGEIDGAGLRFRFARWLTRKLETRVSPSHRRRGSFTFMQLATRAVVGVSAASLIDSSLSPLFYLTFSCSTFPFIIPAWGCAIGWQKINHFCGMLEICRKRAMARNLMKMARQFPQHFDFFPRTFILPGDREVGNCAVQIVCWGTFFRARLSIYNCL